LTGISFTLQTQASQGNDLFFHPQLQLPLFLHTPLRTRAPHTPNAQKIQFEKARYCGLKQGSRKISC